MIGLTFDLATNTGWAAGDLRGHPDFGSERFGDAGSCHGAKFTECYLLTKSLIIEYNPEVIAIEKAISGGVAGAEQRAQMALGYRAAVLMACYNARKKAPQEFAINAIRKHFTGSGKGGGEAKQRTMEVCLKKGWVIDNDNEADALAVWDMLGHSLDLRKSMPTGGLFDGV